MSIRPSNAMWLVAAGLVLFAGSRVGLWLRQQRAAPTTVVRADATSSGETAAAPPHSSQVGRALDSSSLLPRVVELSPPPHSRELSDQERANLEVPAEMNAARQALGIRLQESSISNCVKDVPKDSIIVSLRYSVIASREKLIATDPVLTDAPPEAQDCLEAELPARIETEPIGETRFPTKYVGPLDHWLVFRKNSRADESVPD